MVPQIWALTREQFDLTKEHYMKGEVKIVDEKFDLEWQSIIFEEMNVPMYSGIAFHLYLIAIEGSGQTFLSIFSWKSYRLLKILL